MLNLSEAELCPNFRFVKGNVLSADLLNFVMDTENIDTVLHFAAQTHLDSSFGNSFSFNENNILATHKLLEAARFHKTARFVHVSTDEVYGTREKDGSSSVRTEEDNMEPNHPYSATKAAAEVIVQSYFQSFKLPTVVARVCNVYGPRQSPEKIIPKFLNLLQRGQKLPVHGEGSQIHNFLFASDVAAAFDKLLHCAADGSIYNVGGGEANEHSNLDLAKEAVKLYGRDDSCIEFVESLFINDERCRTDCGRIAALGWKPEVSFKDGLKITDEWYKANGRRFSHIEEMLQAHPHAPRKSN